jgi:predicted metal-binding membrane protein
VSHIFRLARVGDAYRLAIIGSALAAWLVLALQHGAASAPSAHDHMTHGAGTAAVLPGGRFLADWTLMIVAMMLPLSLPLARFVSRAAAGEERLTHVIQALGGYLAIWIAFGGVALLVSATLSQVIALLPLPDPARWSMIVVAGVAGAYQLTPAKRRCLDQCQALHAAADSSRGRSANHAPLRAGLAYGAWSLGSCWALMLLMVVVDAAPLAWMLALTGVMIGEHTRHGDRLIRPVTLALLALVAWQIALIR